MAAAAMPRKTWLWWADRIWGGQEARGGEDAERRGCMVLGCADCRWEDPRGRPGRRWPPLAT
eukprot:5202065-Prymnesium_polylepis.1